MRIGIANGGGDAPALNAVLRAVVKTAIVRYQGEVIGFYDGFKGMIEGVYEKLSLSYVSGLLPKGGIVLGTTNRDNPFKYHGRDASLEVQDCCRRLGLDVLVSVGGEGTLGITYDLIEKCQIAAIGVPKTIDNDFPATDYTFGFRTAVGTATHALDVLHDTAESHHRVMVLEVMGRTAGWIALHAGVAGGADIIMIPEIPWNIESVIAKIKDRESHGKRFSIIVVAEGVQIPTDNVCPTSPGPYLARKIQEMTGVECRSTVLGHLQRGGSPVPDDRILGTMFGSHAVDLAAAKQYNRVVVLRGTEVTSVPFTSEMKEARLVHKDSQLVQVARNLGMFFGDELPTEEDVS
jgi:6-phosphofructokinase 1